VGSFLAELEAKLEAYVPSSNTYQVTVTYDALIDQDWFAAFTANFTVVFNFNYSEAGRTLFNTLRNDALNN
jgi:hypothetical protein